VSRTQNISEATAQKIDSEIRRIIDECYQRAYGILSSRINDLHTVAKGLLEYETLTGDEIKGLLVGKPPVRESADEPPSTKASAVPSTKGKPKAAGEPDAGMEPQPQA
jgi:cell division protease FtsH